MLRKVFVLCGLLFVLIVLSGCMKEEPMPQIMYGAPSVIVPPKAAPLPKQPTRLDLGTSGGWIPPAYLEKGWTAIVIHHSGTPKGNAAIFDEWHKEGRHWEGVGYDFVIGNGTDSSDGEIEPTFRWWQQKVGAHCGGTPGNWANVDGIGICLVGDFNHTYPTSRQMQSLSQLVRFLESRYKIPKSRIYGHNTTPGASGKTDCPGRNFPMYRLKSMVD